MSPDTRQADSARHARHSNDLALVDSARPPRNLTRYRAAATASLFRSSPRTARNPKDDLACAKRAMSKPLSDCVLLADRHHGLSEEHSWAARNDFQQRLSGGRRKLADRRGRAAAASRGGRGPFSRCGRRRGPDARAACTGSRSEGAAAQRPRRTERPALGRGSRCGRRRSQARDRHRSLVGRGRSSRRPPIYPAFRCS